MREPFAGSVVVHSLVPRDADPVSQVSQWTVNVNHTHALQSPDVRIAGKVSQIFHPHRVVKFGAGWVSRPNGTD